MASITSLRKVVDDSIGLDDVSVIEEKDGKSGALILRLAAGHSWRKRTDGERFDDDDNTDATTHDERHEDRRVTYGGTSEIPTASRSACIDYLITEVRRGTYSVNGCQAGCTCGKAYHDKPEVKRDLERHAFGRALREKGIGDEAMAKAERLDRIWELLKRAACELDETLQDVPGYKRGDYDNTFTSKARDLFDGYSVRHEVRDHVNTAVNETVDNVLPSLYRKYPDRRLKDVGVFDRIPDSLAGDAEAVRRFVEQHEADKAAAEAADTKEVA